MKNELKVLPVNDIINSASTKAVTFYLFDGRSIEISKGDLYLYDEAIESFVTHTDIRIAKCLIERVETD